MIQALRRAAILGGALLALGCAGSVPGPANPSPGASSGDRLPAVAEGTERQLMVTYPPAPPSLWARTTSELAQLYNLRTVFSWTLSSLGEQCVVFEVPRDRSVPELMRRLASYPRVSSVQPIETFTTQGPQQSASDPYAHLQHGSQALRLDRAHRWATGRGVKVAVIDTGVDFDHPDLRERVVKAQNFVERGEGTFTTDIHGTAVAGLIAASAGNQIGIVGVAPGAEIFALKACWPKSPGSREATCNSYTLAKAMDFAIVQQAQVINFSLAGPRDPLLGRLIGTALSRGIVVVAADGGAPARGFPASLEGVLGVLGSDDLKKGLARPTERSPTTTLAAPAVDILSTAPHSAYDFFSGSSLAAAQVSGVAALLLEKNPKLTPAQIADIVRKTAQPLANSPPLPVVQVDACAAVASVVGEGGC
jgi:subtilisin family serine protease